MTFVINPYRFGGADSLLTDLVAWWSLDETSGTRVNAHNPGTHDMTEVNGVGYITGKQGNAADFAGGGAQDMLTTAHHADFVIADTDFTVAGWCLMTSTTDTAGRIVCKGFGGSAGGEWTVQRQTTSQNVLLRVRNAGDTATVNAGGVAFPAYDTFFFFIFEHIPASNLITLEVNRGTPATGALTGGTYSGTNPVTIGNDAVTAELDGAVDEVGVWRRLLETAEKDRLYNSGSGMAYPG